jgi:3-hydroxyanthranilate 3,4-dioxygenase
MFPPPLVKLEEVTDRLRDTQKRVEVLWQEPESLAFVARGREYRSEFHINDSESALDHLGGVQAIV